MSIRIPDFEPKNKEFELEVASFRTAGTVPREAADTLYVSTHYRALVSEPGFLDFQISRFSMFEISLFSQNMFEQSGGEISRKSNKGVLDRPWAK